MYYVGGEGEDLVVDRHGRNKITKLFLMFFPQRLTHYVIFDVKSIGLI
jgi:hypothetical protein